MAYLIYPAMKGFVNCPRVNRPNKFINSENKTPFLYLREMGFKISIAYLPSGQGLES
jgi:hypothetical protein